LTGSHSQLVLNDFLTQHSAGSREELLLFLELIRLPYWTEVRDSCFSLCSFVPLVEVCSEGVWFWAWAWGDSGVVFVAVFVAVLVIVFVSVLVTVLVSVFVAVLVIVLVSVFVAVLVIVFVPVFVAVLVIVFVSVLVAEIWAGFWQEGRSAVWVATEESMWTETGLQIESMCLREGPLVGYFLREGVAGCDSLASNQN